MQMQNQSLPTSLLGRWLYAIKWPSWPKLLLPTIFGMSWAFYEQGTKILPGILPVLLYTICLLVCIVLWNDFADEKVDRIKRRLFPSHCSPKTIPDGILPAKSLFVAGSIFGILSFIVVFLIFSKNRDWAMPLSLFSVFVFVCYSFPPIQLNYRGGGEFLEMGGVGFYLPYYIRYLLVDSIQLPELSVLFFLISHTLLAFSSALASGFSDEVSDREGGKHTFVIFFGNRKTHLIIRYLLLGVLFFNLLIGFLNFNFVFWSFTIFSILLSFYFFPKIWNEGILAETNAFASQNRYKSFLHNYIWFSTFTFSLILVLA